MSKTLVCLSETLPFYTQDICKDKSFNFDSSVDNDSPNKNKTEKKCSVVSESIPQDENKYANMQHNSADQTLLKKSSKKREASNILMECVKRRENMQNVECNSNVPFEISNCNFVPVTTHEQVLVSDVFDKEITVQTLKSDNLTDSNSADSCSIDSGIDSSKSSSPSHSFDIVNGLDNEICPDLMEVDILDNNTSDLSQKSAAISEDLDSLNLEESSESKDSDSAKPSTIQGLFKNSPSMLYFSMKEEIVEPLSPDALSLLKWKLSTITPVLIRETVLKRGFSLVEADTTEDWVGTWGKHLKCTTYQKIKSFQKVNHYPGGFHLGRKDRLWNNIKRMQSRHGKEKFSFFPDTYVLPADIKILKKIWNEETDRCWITKPCASARGAGVKVIFKWSQVPKTNPAVVQRYISDPYLINGSKFDLRVYVLVPSFNPLRIYVYQDGLVRFASEKYSLSNKSFANRYIHLTNYSINKKSSAYTSNDDENICQGHKWSLKSFWSYMSDSGIDVEKIKATIVDMIIKTVISAEGSICRLIKMHTGRSYNCFELFGFDIMLDKELRPWLLEVNISPSLHTKSTLDYNVKRPLVKDMLNIAGFEVPQKNSDNDTVHLQSDSNRHQPTVRILRSNERKKHTLFSSKYAHKKANILENLTLDDISCLMESEDEYTRRGSFVRVFPTNASYKYFVYFQRLNYYNVLLDAWEQTFYEDRSKGIEFLQESYDKLKSELQDSQKETKEQEPELDLTITEL